VDVPLTCKLPLLMTALVTVIAADAGVMLSATSAATKNNLFIL